MGNSNHFYLLIFALILAVHVSLSSSTAVDFLPIKTGCSGSIAECMMGGDDDMFDVEFALDSESNRRILAARKYISYGALRRNSVPCSRRGASYYNCKPGAQANPYSRGCSRITRCRS